MKLLELMGRYPVWKKIVAGTLAAAVMFGAGTLHALATSTDGQARVTARSLNLRQAPSEKSSIITSVKRDETLSLVDVSNPDWYLVTVKGKRGYVSSKYVKVIKPPQTNASGGSSIKKTDSSLQPFQTASGDIITPDVLSFLASLGYKEGDAVSVYYDGRSISFIMPSLTPATAQESSQTSSSAPSTGTMILADPNASEGLPYPQQTTPTNNTINAIDSHGVPVYQKGDRGSAIVQLQTALFSLGLFNEMPTGYFGDVTRAAVQAYQITRGKPVTEYVDEALFIEIVAAGMGPSNAPLPTTPTPSTTAAELAEWDFVKEFWKPGQVATVTDVRTGISWQLKRWAGTKHADCEPLTANDTALMKQAYGGAFDYVRRPLWVTVNGRTFAASIYGVPHSTQTIYDNNYNGQCCLHFIGSKTHDSDRMDAGHQASIYEAYAAGQR